MQHMPAGNTPVTSSMTLMTKETSVIILDRFTHIWDIKLKRTSEQTRKTNSKSLDMDSSMVS